MNVENVAEVIPRPFPPMPEAPPHPRAMPALRRAMLWVLFLEMVIGSISLGLTARRWTWEWTQGVRRSEDMNNGWGWGERALRYGYVRLYEHVIANRPDGDYTLDYPPLRLGVMTAWAWWTNKYADGAAGWRDDYAFTAPLLHFNTLVSLIAAVGVFAIVRLWSVRADPGAAAGEVAEPRPFHGWARGLAAAVLFWLNPALLLDGYGWPQWDVWPVPFFVFALLAASTERWLIAGALLGMGAMFKGQLMLVAPLFVFWPLFMRAWKAAADVVLGCFAMVALITAPWLIGHGAIAVAGVTAGAWIVAGRRACGWRRWRAVMLAGTLGLFLCPLLFGGSMAWFKIGFCYGAEKFGDMSMGAENLASLLQRNFGLRCKDAVFTIDWRALRVYQVVTVKQLMAASYFLTLIVASSAAARHRARGDARFLVAAVMPWVLFFALMTQMHERYLVWAACISAVWVGAGFAMTMLHLLISALAFLIMAASMLAVRPAGWPVLAEVIRATSAGLPWTVLLAAGLVTLAAVTSSRSSVAQPARSRK